MTLFPKSNPWCWKVVITGYLFSRNENFMIFLNFRNQVLRANKLVVIIWNRNNNVIIIIVGIKLSAKFMPCVMKHGLIIKISRGWLLYFPRPHNVIRLWGVKCFIGTLWVSAAYKEAINYFAKLQKTITVKKHIVRTPKHLDSRCSKHFEWVQCMKFKNGDTAPDL